MTKGVRIIRISQLFFFKTIGVGKSKKNARSFLSHSVNRSFSSTLATHGGIDGLHLLALFHTSFVSTESLLCELVDLLVGRRAHYLNWFQVER